LPFPERVETERLILRRWRPGDLDAYLAIWADPAVRGQLWPGKPPDPEHLASRFQHQLDHWRQHGFGLWHAIQRATDESAGWIGAWYPDFIPELVGEIEIGWALRRPFWGHGLATEGARAAADSAATHLNPPRLISIINPANTRSISVASRLGMGRARAVRHPQLDIELDVYELSGSSSSRGASPHSTSSR
jgi:RimJ/RimL family protein N-acetyltransferase